MIRDDEQHPMTLPENERRAEAVDAAPELPLAPPSPLPPRVIPGMCRDCGYRSSDGKDNLCADCRAFNARAAAEWTDDDEAECRAPARTDYHKRISTENERRGFTKKES